MLCHVRRSTGLAHVSKLKIAVGCFDVSPDPLSHAEVQIYLLQIFKFTKPALQPFMVKMFGIGRPVVKPRHGFKVR